MLGPGSLQKMYSLKGLDITNDRGLYRGPAEFTIKSV